MSQPDQSYQSATAPRTGPRPGAAAAPGNTGAPGAPGGDPARAVPATGSVAQMAGAPRKVRLTLARIDPWSVLKISFLFSVAMGVALVTGVLVLWMVVDGMGVFDNINSAVRSVAGSSTSFNVFDYVNLGSVMAFAVFVAVLDVLLVMAISTLSAFVYNIGAALVGGLTLTLSDE